MRRTTRPPKYTAQPPRRRSSVLPVSAPPPPSPPTTASLSLPVPLPPPSIPIEEELRIVGLEVPTRPRWTPSNVSLLGHKEAYGKLLDHLFSDKRHAPIVLWGPTGCGKTFLARACLSNSGFRAVELDGVEAEDTARLVAVVSHTRRARAYGGAADVERTKRSRDGTYVTTRANERTATPALLVEDVESFTPDARRELVRTLKRTSRTGASPTILTCTQLRHPDMHALADLANVRMRPPRDDAILDLLTSNPPCPPVYAIKRALSDGVRDVRRVRRDAELIALGRGGAARGGALPSSSFEASRLLLQRRCSVDVWSRVTEWRDACVLQHHLPSYVGDDVDLLDEAFDSLSAIDACHPDRYECATSHAHVRQYAAGSCVRLTSRARDVGALAPPRPPAPRPNARPPISDGEERPPSRESWLDAPALLRDRASTRTSS